MMRTLKLQLNRLVATRQKSTSCIAHSATRYKGIGSKALLLGLLLPFLLTGCSNDSTDLKDKIAQIRSRPTKAAPEVPKIEPFKGFRYEAGTLRNPFENLVEKEEKKAQIAASGGDVKPDKNREKEPLEAYSLNDLTLVGTLNRPSGPWVLIKTSDEAVHSVTLGNYLGKNSGKIIAISETELTLSEIVSNGFGGWQRQASELSMQQPK